MGSRMKRLTLFLLFLAGAAVLLWQPLGGRAVAPAYSTVTVDRGDLTVSVAAAGTLNAVVLVEVGSQISGQVKEVFVDFNSPVERGQLIARIDPDILQARVAAATADVETAEAGVVNQAANVEKVTADLESARASAATAMAHVERMHAEVESARALIAAARAMLARETATVANARLELDRRLELFEKQLISRSEKEQAQTTFDTAQAQQEAARSQLRAGEAALRSAQAQLVAMETQAQAATAAVGSTQAAIQVARAQLTAVQAGVRQRRAALEQARVDLRHTEIRAPVNGVVISRNVNVGQTVAASLQAPTLFTIAQDLRRMQVEATVIEADVTRFATGQTVTFTVDAHPGRVFTGRVRQIRKAPKVRENIVTYVVVISVEDPTQALLPGMTATLQVVIAQRQGVLKVPNAALRFRPADQALDETPGASGRVFIVGRDGQPVPVSLRPGITDGRMTEVLAGDLAEGQPVITGMAASAELPNSGFFKLRLQ